MHQINNMETYRLSFAFYTLVTRFDEYQEMVKSAKTAGFDQPEVEFYYFDNKNNNLFDGYSGVNRALKNKDAQYIIICHQDILFNYDNYDKLRACIENLDRDHPDWAIAGNAGKDKLGRAKMKIGDPHGENQEFGPFPAQVISLDENFLIINNRYNLSCTNILNGFHLYGLDLCTNAIHLGLKCYVIDFHLFHKSAGNIDQSFFESRKKFIQVQEARREKTFFSTTCTNFYVTNFKCLNIFLNQKIIIKICSYLRRNFGKHEII